MKRKLNVNSQTARADQAELIGHKFVTISSDWLRGVSGEAGEPDVGQTSHCVATGNLNGIKADNPN